VSYLVGHHKTKRDAPKIRRYYTHHRVRSRFPDRVARRNQKNLPRFFDAKGFLTRIIDGMKRDVPRSVRKIGTGQAKDLQCYVLLGKKFMKAMQGR